MTDGNDVQYVSLADVKNIMKKVEKEREELTYEQRNTLDHVNRFAKLSLTKTKELLKELESLSFVDEKQAIKIADLLPVTADDVRAIFAKERSSPSEGEIQQIVKLVEKYYNEI